MDTQTWKKSTKSLGINKSSNLQKNTQRSLSLPLSFLSPLHLIHPSSLSFHPLSTQMIFSQIKALVRKGASSNLVIVTHFIFAFQRRGGRRRGSRGDEGGGGGGGGRGGRTTATAAACFFFFFLLCSHRCASDLRAWNYRIAAHTAIRQQQHQRSPARWERRTGEAEFRGPAAGLNGKKAVTISSPLQPLPTLHSLFSTPTLFSFLSHSGENQH